MFVKMGFDCRRIASSSVLVSIRCHKQMQVLIFISSVHCNQLLYNENSENGKFVVMELWKKYCLFFDGQKPMMTYRVYYYYYYYSHFLAL